MDMPRRMFGKPKVAGEKEFFDLAKGQYETRQNLQAAGERYSQAVARSLKDALNGEDSSFTDVYAKKAKHADMIDDKDEGHFYVGSLRVIEQAKQDIAHFKGPAERVWDTLARYSALRKDIPDLDAKEVFGQYLKQRGEVFFAVLPLGLIGGGFAGAQDFSPVPISSTIRISCISECPKSRSVRFLAHATLARRNPELPTLESSTLKDGTREWRLVMEAPVEQGPQYLTPAEMKGQSVTLTFTDPVSGEREVTMPAEKAQSIVKHNIDAYSHLIDCLLR